MCKISLKKIYKISIKKCKKNIWKKVYIKKNEKENNKNVNNLKKK